jgi:hypothetical protein
MPALARHQKATILAVNAILFNASPGKASIGKDVHCHFNKSILERSAKHHRADSGPVRTSLMQIDPQPETIGFEFEPKIWPSNMMQII